MSNAYIQLPTPISNGVGPAIDVTDLSSIKTIIIAGTFDAVVSVETSSDGGATFGPVASYQGPKFQTLTLSATHMRVRLSGLLSGTPVVFVGSYIAATTATILDIPPGNGPGASSDVSDIGNTLTLVVAGSFGGSINIEVSDNDIDWASLAFFNNAGIATISCFSNFMRVVRSGVGFDPGVPVVAVASSSGNEEETPAFTSPPKEIVIYARLTGSNSSGKGTLAKPYRTFARAIRDVPMFIPPGVFYIVDITGLGVETLPADYALPAFKGASADFTFDPTGLTTIRTSLTVRAVPQLVASIPPAASVINAGDIASVSYDSVTQIATYTLNVARPSWGGVYPGALVGKFVRGSGTAGFFGENFFESGIVVSSTPTTLEVVNFAPFNPFFFTTTPPISIVEPSTTLSTGGENGFQAEGVDSIQMVGIKFSNYDGGHSFASRGNWALLLTFCDVRDLNINRVPGFASTLALNFTYWHDPQYFDLVYGSLDLFTAVLRNLSLGEISGGTGIPATPNLVAGRGVVLDGCTGMEFGTNIFLGGPAAANALVFANSEIRNGVAGEAPAAITFHGSMGRIQDCRISNFPGNAIQFYQGQGFLDLINVVGSGNTGLGVQVNDGAQVRADSSTSVTGAGGAYQVGVLAPVAVWPGPTNVADPATFARLNRL